MTQMRVFHYKKGAKAQRRQGAKAENVLCIIGQPSLKLRLTKR